MTRMKRTSTERKETTPVRVEGEGETERYATAFTRVRLLRAWIAAAAALVAVLFSYVALWERVVK